MSIVIGSANGLSISPERICDFYDKNWARKIALSDEEFYKWQFINNPSQHGTDECCVAVDGDEIIGVMGLNQRDFYIKGKRLKGAELTTWVVSESKRNNGSGPKMITYLKDQYDVMIGMGISQAALPIYLRNGFRYLKAIPRYVAPIDWDAVGPFIEAAPLAKKYNREQLMLTDYTISPNSPPITDRIYNEFMLQHCSFSRNSKDASWRYDQHPYFKYEQFIVNNSCFVSVRIDRDVDGFVMAHCVDIFGSHSDYKAAISAAINFAKDNGAHAIDFFGTNTTLCAELNEMGLFSTLDHDFFKFPHLFHPVEIRNPATTSLIMWAKNGLGEILDLGNLHVTKQDADFDRPTAQAFVK
ncbi:UNVERIFIED_ORG: hypothetical protein J2Y78_002897 [Buttiauxella agrestis ATCC 33320]